MYAVEMTALSVCFDPAPSVDSSVSDPNGMTDDVVEKSALMPAGDSWLSSALYLLSLWDTPWKITEDIYTSRV